MDPTTSDLLVQCWPLLVFRDLADEPIPATMCRFNEAWGFWIVAEGLADLTNGHLENGIANKCFRPDSAQKFLFRDELPRMPEKIVEHSEGLRSELYSLGALP